MPRTRLARFAAAGVLAATTAVLSPAAQALPGLPGGADVAGASLPAFTGGPETPGGKPPANPPAAGLPEGLPGVPGSSLPGSEPVARSGSGIIMTYADGTQGICTLNSVSDVDGVAYGVTAGHCMQPHDGHPVVRVSSRLGDVTLADADDIAAGGHVMEGDATPFNPTGSLDDFAWFRLADGVQRDADGVSGNLNTGVEVLDTYLAAPRLEQGEAWPVDRVHPGSVVCKDGTMSGRTCGVVLHVNPETQEIFAVIPAVGGDSGSPLWVMGRDGRTHVVGTLSNGTPVLFNIFDGTQQQLAARGLN